MQRKTMRKNYFVKKNFQGRYIFTYFLFVLFGSSLVALLVGLHSADTLTITYENSALRIGTTSMVLMTNFLKYHGISLLAGVVFIVVTAMFLTHRIAGPLYKVEEILDSMLTGDLTGRLNLREKDEIVDIAGKINDFNTLLGTNIQSAQHLTLEMDNHINQASIAEGDQSVQNHLKTIGELNQQLQTILTGFQV
ncbi:methyl-accepting chemotaxis protein [Thermodesulfobacteriota bacterium]